MPENQDTDWDWKEFVARNNDELVATWGNLANRVLAFCYKHWEGHVPHVDPACVTPGGPGIAGCASKPGSSTVGRSAGGRTTARRIAGSHPPGEQRSTSTSTQPRPGSRSRPTRTAAAKTIYTALKAIDSLKVLFAPFLPFTSEKLNGFFGYETPLFGEQYTETVSDSLGEHTVLRYRVGQIAGLPAWKPSQLKPGTKLNQPGPLFKKLEESVVEEERARLGK